MTHPLDPLGPTELAVAAEIIRKKFEGKEFSFNTLTLNEPKKSAYETWKSTGKAPSREVFYVIIFKGKYGVCQGICDITKKEVITSDSVENVFPILLFEDLCNTIEWARKNPKVIEQCVISGIKEDEMHKVYCDAWTIGYDERWGHTRRLQQALMYFRENEDDSQYSQPLDFCPIFDTETEELVEIDIPSIRRPVNRIPASNFYPKDQEKMRDPIKISVTQPEGVSYKMDGRVINWENFSIHIGFNGREGIVLSDVTYNDHGNVRPLFHRMSIAEMVVPYGEPGFPHQRKHAFDLGEYGAGFLTNPLALGCDCKGVIHYMDAHFTTRQAEIITIKNAICIHEEDDGILFKHSDYRDGYKTSICTRGTRLVISHIFTAGNYEYLVYWIFHQDGTIQLDVKLSGILSTYILDANAKDAGLFGTQVYPGVNAQNHQHLFSLRLHPNIDGGGNSVAMVDATPYEPPVGSAENKYGNGFYAKRTVFKTSGESQTSYNAATCRTWDFFNPKKLHKYSNKPASYKLVSREVSPLMAKPNSLVWKRAAFARNAMAVVPYKDDEFYPAGLHVPQTSGEPSKGITEWIDDGKASIEDTEVVAYHTFGITHFPAPEDFPVMPTEPITLLLRPRNFFLQNPAMDVPPSNAMTTTEARKADSGVTIESLTDTTSKLAFDQKQPGSKCNCS